MFATQKIVAGIGNLRAKQTTKSADPATSLCLCEGKDWGGFTAIKARSNNPPLEGG